MLKALREAKPMLVDTEALNDTEVPHGASVFQYCVLKNTEVHELPSEPKAVGNKPEFQQFETCSETGK